MNSNSSLIQFRGGGPSFPTVSVRPSICSRLSVACFPPLLPVLCPFSLPPALSAPVPVPDPTLTLWNSWKPPHRQLLPPQSQVPQRLHCPGLSPPPPAAAPAAMLCPPPRCDSPARLCGGAGSGSGRSALAPLPHLALSVCSACAGSSPLLLLSTPLGRVPSAGPRCSPWGLGSPAHSCRRFPHPLTPSPPPAPLPGRAVASRGHTPPSSLFLSVWRPGTGRVWGGHLQSPRPGAAGLEVRGPWSAGWRPTGVKISGGAASARAATQRRHPPGCAAGSGAWPYEDPQGCTPGSGCRGRRAGVRCASGPAGVRWVGRALRFGPEGTRRPGVAVALAEALPGLPSFLLSVD